MVEIRPTCFKSAKLQSNIIRDDTTLSQWQHCNMATLSSKWFSSQRTTANPWKRTSWPTLEIFKTNLSIKYIPSEDYYSSYMYYYNSNIHLFLLLNRFITSAYNYTIAIRYNTYVITLYYIWYNTYVITLLSFVTRWLSILLMNVFTYYYSSIQH